MLRLRIIYSHIVTFINDCYIFSKMKTSKEMEDLIRAISAYIDKHEGNVQFYGSFCAFKGKDYKVVDDRVFAFGLKETLLIDIEELQKNIEKEKEDFINW